AGGLLDRLFHRFDDDRLVDHLLAGDGISDREQFCLVGGNRTGHQSFAFSSSETASISSAPVMSSGRVAAISLSVRTSFAEPIFASGTSTRPALRSSTMTTPFSMPASSPRNRR